MLNLDSPPEGRTSSVIFTWEAALDGLPTAVRRAEQGGGCHPRWAPGSGVSPPGVGGAEEYGLGAPQGKETPWGSRGPSAGSPHTQSGHEALGHP